MTLWKNSSEDIVSFPFDLGNGKREVVTLAPAETVEIPSKYDSVVNTEAPQLVMVKDIPEPVASVQPPLATSVLEPIKPKRNFKKGKQ